MTFDMRSEIVSLIASSMACVREEIPRPDASEERREVRPSVMRLPRAPKSPVAVLDPLFDVKPVGVGSPGKEILGSGSWDAIALPAEARMLESTEALDATAEERAGINPKGSKGLKASLLPSFDGTIVAMAVRGISDIKISRFVRLVEVVLVDIVVVGDVVAVGANSMIPDPKFVVLNCQPRSQPELRIQLSNTL
jgi:hypothetical protein